MAKQKPKDDYSGAFEILRPVRIPGLGVYRPGNEQAYIDAAPDAETVAEHRKAKSIKGRVPKARAAERREAAKATPEVAPAAASEAVSPDSQS